MDPDRPPAPGGGTGHHHPSLLSETAHQRQSRHQQHHQHQHHGSLHAYPPHESQYHHATQHLPHGHPHHNPPPPPPAPPVQHARYGNDFAGHGYRAHAQALDQVQDRDPCRTAHQGPATTITSNALMARPQDGHGHGDSGGLYMHSPPPPAPTAAVVAAGSVRGPGHDQVGPLFGPKQHQVALAPSAQLTHDMYASPSSASSAASLVSSSFLSPGSDQYPQPHRTNQLHHSAPSPQSLPPTSPRSATYPPLLSQGPLPAPGTANMQCHPSVEHQQQLHGRSFPRTDTSSYPNGPLVARSPANSPYVDAHMQHYQRAFSAESVNSNSAFSPASHDSSHSQSQPISPRMSQYDSPQVAQLQQAASPPTAPYFPSRAGFPMPGPARMHPPQPQEHAVPPAHAPRSAQPYETPHRGSTIAPMLRHPIPQLQNPPPQAATHAAGQSLPSGVYQPQLHQRPMRQPDHPRPISTYVPPKQQSGGSNPVSTPTSPTRVPFTAPSGGGAVPQKQRQHPLPPTSGAIGFPIYPPMPASTSAGSVPAPSGTAQYPLARPSDPTATATAAPIRRNPMSLASLLDDAPPAPVLSSSTSSSSSSSLPPLSQSRPAALSSPTTHFPLVSGPTTASDLLPMAAALAAQQQHPQVRAGAGRAVPAWPMPPFVGGTSHAPTGSQAVTMPLATRGPAAPPPPAASALVAKKEPGATTAAKPPAKKKRKVAGPAAAAAGAGGGGSAASSPGLSVVHPPMAELVPPPAGKAPANGLVFGGATKKNNSKDRASTPMGGESRPGSALGKAAAAAKKDGKEKEKEQEKAKEKEKEKVKGPLYCICRKPYDNSKFYIQCDGCQDWLHGTCIGVTSQQSKAFDLFFCKECTILGRGITTKHARCKYPPCSARAETAATPSSSFCSPQCGRAWAEMQLDQGPLDLASSQLTPAAPIVIPDALFAAVAQIAAWSHVDATDARMALAAVRALKRIRVDMRVLDAQLHMLSLHALEMVPDNKRLKPIVNPADGGAGEVAAQVLSPSAPLPETAMPSSESTLTTVPSSDATALSMVGSNAIRPAVLPDVNPPIAPGPPICGCPIQVEPGTGRVVTWCHRVKCNKHGQWRRVFKARLAVKQVKLLESYRLARVGFEQAMARVARRRQDWDRVLFHATRVEHEEEARGNDGVWAGRASEPASAGFSSDPMDVDPPSPNQEQVQDA